MQPKPYPSKEWDEHMAATLRKGRRDKFIGWAIIAIVVIAIAAFCLANAGTAACHGDGYQTICRDSTDTWAT